MHPRRGVDVKAALCHGVHHGGVEHQVAQVALGNQHALLAVQPGGLAHAKPALYFFVDAAHRQHLAVLVERAGDGNALQQRHTRQRRKHRKQLGARGRVAFYAVVFLLEHDGGVERQRRQVTKQRGQVAVQNQHAFVVDGAGHLDLALDVEQPLVAGVGACAHPHRQAKAPVAQVDLRQAVDLADFAALARNEPLAVGNGFAQALFGVVVAQAARGQGGVHVGGFHAAGGAGAAQCGAFGHQRFGACKDGALAGLVVHLAVRVFQQAGHGRCRQRRQAVFAAGVGHKHGGGLARVVGGGEAFRKVHLDAKAPGKFRVAFLQRVVVFHRPDQDEFDFCVHRLGLQRHGRHGHQRCARFFNLHAPAAQVAAHLFPGLRVGEQVAQVQQQKAAVGFQQAAGAHTRKVGHQHVFFGLVFDAAKQRVRDRVVFHDHRRAAQAAVVHHHIDLVAHQQLLQRGQALFVVFVLHDEEFNVLQHVVQHPVEVVTELHRVLDLLFQADPDFLQLVVEQGLGHLTAQRGQAFVHHAGHGPGFVQKLRDLFAQLGFGLVHFGAAFARQAVGFRGGERVAAVAHEGEHQVALFAKQVKVARLGKCLQRRKGARFFALVGVFYALAFGLEVLAVQAQGHVALQRFAQLLHQLAQLAPLPGGHAQRARALGCVKVVQVTQVGRHRACGGHALRQFAQQGGTAAAHLAQHKQVVVGLVHRHAKAGGLFGALLADPGHRLRQQFGGVLKTQRAGVDGQPKLLGLERGGGHSHPSNAVPRFRG